MESRTLGDYRLLEPLVQKSDRILWQAEQASVQRPVVVVELTDLSLRDSFLAEIRAKASVDHPFIGSVFEAVAEDESCFAALERLPGETLAERLRSGEAMEPLAFAVLLRRVAEAMLHFHKQELASEPLTPAAIHIDGQGVVRIENLAIGGEPDPEEIVADLARIGKSLAPLVAEGRPGASRLLTILGWMRGIELERPLTWEETRRYAEQVEGQLLETQELAGPPTSRAKASKSPFLMVVGAGLALAAVAVIILMRGGEESAPAAATSDPRPGPVRIEAGDHPTPDGETVSLPAFRISPTEVTIGEYLEFLEVLELLDPEDRAVFDHEGQPPEKSGHEPDDWAAMLEAAKTGGVWRERPLSLDHPIVNVDWWDAAAYCEWRSSRLPTQEEWFAALKAGAEKPEELRASGWASVDALSAGDRTSSGLRGMAGSVAEWTRRPAANPANPLGARQWVILGGSYLEPAQGALTRTWTNDRLQRRPDLGFRVVLGE